MTELTPVIRADYTGKLVTRHVKASPATPSTRTIAAPTVAKPDSMEDLTTTLLDALQIGVNDVREVLDRYQLESLITLAHSHDMSVAGPELVNGMATINGEPFHECVGLLDRNFELANSIMDSLEYRAMHYRAQVPLLVTGMNLHSFPMTPADEQVLTEAVCRIWVSDALDDNTYVERTFPSRGPGTEQRSIGRTAIREDLAQYIVDNHDKTAAIISIVTDRKINDPKEIDAMLNGVSTQALAEGVL